MSCFSTAQKYKQDSRFSRKHQDVSNYRFSALWIRGMWWGSCLHLGGNCLNWLNSKILTYVKQPMSATVLITKVFSVNIASLFLLITLIFITKGISVDTVSFFGSVFHIWHSIKICWQGNYLNIINYELSLTVTNNFLLSFMGAGGLTGK